MNEPSPTHFDQLSELLTVLADRRCRATLTYFRDAPEDVASVRDLADAIDTGHRDGGEQLVYRLHHSALPRLAEYDAVEYDTRSRTVRYRGHPELETLLENITECYPTSER